MNNDVAIVKEKTDIVQIIGEHVVLKKAGRHFKGLCPFHNEKSPSFIVSPELQMYKCFGCGESGDVFTFLEKFEGLEFPDVLKILADRAGVKLTPFKGENTGIKEVLFEVNEDAARFYHYVLLNSPQAKGYFDYLLETREIKKETIESFGIGSALESSNSLFDFLTVKKKYKPEVLVEAGLVYKSENGRYFDRFRGRVIFPIQNARGATIALAGRILPTLPKAKELAKYINSPETPIYHKSESLFGILQAREDIKRKDFAIVVEGELDMISPWQNGIKNIVAIKGSAMTESHARVLSRLTKTIVLALDSDFAGNNAAIKGIAQAQNVGLTVKVANLGKFKDPDDFVRSDKEGFKKAIDSAIGVWDFIIDTYFARFDASSADGKAALSRELLPHLSNITDSILRAHYVRLIANRLEVPEDAVTKAMASVTQKFQPPIVLEESIPSEKKGRRDLLEERLLVLGLMLNVELVQAKDFREVVKSHYVLRVLEFLDRYLADKAFVLTDFVDTLPPELRDNFVKSLLSDEQTPSDNNLEFKEALHELKELTIREQLSELTTQIKKLDSEDEISEISAIQAKIGELTNALAQLS